MIAYLFLSGLIFLLIGKWCTQVARARKVCREFTNYAAENKPYLQDIVKQAKKGYDFRIEKKIIHPKEEVFLIEDNNESPTIHALNDEKKRNITKRQYTRLIHKLKKRRFVCSYDIDTIFLYYKYDAPYGNYILWISCRSENIF